MKLEWDTYFYNLWSAVLKSVASQGLAWSGLNGLNASGVDVPALNLKALGCMLLMGAVLPALFKFWEQTPLPGIVSEETTTVKRVTVTQDTHPPATPPADPAAASTQDPAPVDKPARMREF